MRRVFDRPFDSLREASGPRSGPGVHFPALFINVERRVTAKISMAKRHGKRDDSQYDRTKS